jgi:hypothetical protein
VHTVISLAVLGLAAQLASAPLPSTLFAMSVPAAPAPVAPAAADATAQKFQFAGTRWGASIDETRKALAAHGFEFEQEAEGGDLVFLGQVNERPALVIALFGPSGLSKILVSVPTQDDSAMSVYRDLRKALDGEYGAPGLEVERYAYPFADGKHVGFELAALRVGKATIGARWQTNGESLGLKIGEGLIVSAHYESPTWGADAEKRRQ